MNPATLGWVLVVVMASIFLVTKEKEGIDEWNLSPILPSILIAITGIMIFVLLSSALWDTMMDILHKLGS